MCMWGPSDTRYRIFDQEQLTKYSTTEATCEFEKPGGLSNERKLNSVGQKYDRKNISILKWVASVSSFQQT